jgi:hypothetical protein
VDLGGALAQALLSVVTPAVITAPFTIRYVRSKMRADARAVDATAEETDAKAEVLLSGQALDLFKEARALATARSLEAEAERAAAARCRRQVVELWAALDACDRHIRRQDHTIADLGGVPLPRSTAMSPRITEDPDA